MKKSVAHLATVYWRDACGSEGYVDDDDDLSPVDMVSSGIVIRANNEYVTLSPTACYDGRYRGYLTIARKMIKRIKYTKVKI